MDIWEQAKEAVIEILLKRGYGGKLPDNTIEIYQTKIERKLEQLMEKGELPRGKYLDQPTLSKFFSNKDEKNKKIIKNKKRGGHRYLDLKKLYCFAVLSDASFIITPDGIIPWLANAIKIKEYFDFIEKQKEGIMEPKQEVTQKNPKTDED
jgi:hypothetical protein